VQPWQLVDSVETEAGRLELRRRGERDFLITIGGRVLITARPAAPRRRWLRSPARPSRGEPAAAY
jgi:hypothetical protein